MRRTVNGFVRGICMPRPCLGDTLIYNDVHIPGSYKPLMSLCLCVGPISTCLRFLHLDTGSDGLSQVGGPSCGSVVPMASVS